ncbi:DUF2971 domain-containing protein [Chryseobacterium sp. MFBS3-17]|uniref:DUF2971 domain-containing protein n=1 Tax=Chryseobacterium sp. MFBS3-17 TaxID=2886689 RepID=UPI001D0EE1D2|nr:DUF2971 domain-containing protein [Chryseobacterium sp. MFBS3-17]MCC2590968.1 DUF2971 domain-containing protein [Chryseobacterium sp. MFBS3-17]
MAKFYKYKGNVNISDDNGRKLFERDLDFIENNKIWLSNINQLNDQNEGIHNLDNFKTSLKAGMKMAGFLGLKKYDEKTNLNYANSIYNFIRVMKENVGIYSLTTDFSNRLMWSHYGNSNMGYCIEYDFDSITDLQLQHINGWHPSHNDRFEQVKYQKQVYSPVSLNFKIEDFFKIVSHKTEEWNYEKEWRILTSISGGYSHKNNIVTSIIFGSRAASEVKEEIINALQKKNIKFYQLERVKENKLVFAKKLIR